MFLVVFSDKWKQSKDFITPCFHTTYMVKHNRFILTCFISETEDLCRIQQRDDIPDLRIL